MILDVYPELEPIFKKEHISIIHSTNLFYGKYSFSIRCKFKKEHNPKNGLTGLQRLMMTSKQAKKHKDNKWKNINNYINELSYKNDDYDIKLYGLWFSIFTSDIKFVKEIIDTYPELVSSISLPKDQTSLDMMTEMDNNIIVKPLWYSQYNYRISFNVNYDKERYDEIYRIGNSIGGIIKERKGSHLTYYTDNEDDIIYYKLAGQHLIKKITKCIQQENNNG